MKIKILLSLLFFQQFYFAMEIPGISSLKQAILNSDKRESKDDVKPILSSRQKQIALYHYLKNLVEKQIEHLDRLEKSDVYKLEHRDELYRNSTTDWFRARGEQVNDHLCYGKPDREKFNEYGINIDKAVVEIIEKKLQKSNIAQELVCQLCRQENIQRKYFLKFNSCVRNYLNLAIKNNGTDFVDLLYKNGFLFHYVRGLDAQGIDNETRNNPLHFLVQKSKDHEDPVGMAQFLVEREAQVVRCNKQKCLTLKQSFDTNLKVASDFKFPHEVLYEQIKDDL